MAQRILTPDIIAREALMMLDNELRMAGLVYRDYSDEFVNVGDTISVRKPVQFEVTDGAAMDLQDVEEGKTTVTIDKRKHVAFSFTAEELTLDIDELSMRVIRPAMIQLANQVDTDLHGLYKYVWNWVGTAGETINSAPDFFKAPQRLSEMAVPMDGVNAILSPADHYGLAGAFTALPAISDTAKSALTRAALPNLAGITSYMSQNVVSHLCGTRDNTTPLTNGTALQTDWATSRDTYEQDLACDGFDSTATIKAGDVFTIGAVGTGIHAVNPITKARLPYLQQFVATEDKTCSGGAVTLKISPCIIFDGPYQTCELVGAANTDGLALTFVGTASTSYAQNLVFHKNAFALVSRPLEIPPGATGAARQSYKGLSVKVTPVYDGVNDVGRWRCDILYGVKAVAPHLATRLSGSS